MSEFPEKVIALDVGDRTIGVATSDLMGIAAHPVETVRRTSIKKDLIRIGELVRENNAKRIVVGLPRMMNGSLGIQAEKVQKFVEKLADAIDIPISRWDERLSTVAAERALIDSGMRRNRRKKVIDQVAAVFFLQGYLDHLAAGGSPPD